MEAVIAHIISMAWVQTFGVGVVSGSIAWFIREQKDFKLLLEMVAIAVFSALFISPLAISLMESFGGIKLDSNARLSVTSIIAISSYSLVKQLADQGLMGFIASMKSSWKSPTAKKKPTISSSKSSKDLSADKREELLKIAKQIKNGHTDD